MLAFFYAICVIVDLYQYRQLLNTEGKFNITASVYKIMNL